MGKLTTYLVVLSVTLLSFHFFGLVTGGTPISVLLSLLLKPANIIDSTFYTQLAATVGVLLVASGVTVLGLYVAQATELIAKAGIASFIITGVVWDLLVVFNKLAEIHIALAAFLISPLLVLAVFAAFEWLFGRD